MKRIFALCLLFPLTLCAMDEAPEKEDLYVGIIAHVLNRLERNKRVDIYPIASTTILYKLPHDHTDPTAFEWVDTIEDLNPPKIDPRIINTYTRPITSVSISDICFLRDQKDGVHKAKMQYVFDSSFIHNTYEIPLGYAYIAKANFGWKSENYTVKPAKFGPAPTVQFLPGSTFEPADNMIESTVPNESLMKCPHGNKTALTIAFLKMEQRYDEQKQRMLYVPEGTQNKDHRE
jgi:hypothetical protein